MTKFIKVAVSDIEKYKWYLRDCENGYYDMFYCKNIEDKTVSGIGIINNEIDNDLEFEKYYFKSDFFEFQEIIDNEEPLLKRNEELEAWKKEAMEVMENLNLQELCKVLNLKLGSDVSKEILPSVKLLIKRNNESEVNPFDNLQFDEKPDEEPFTVDPETIEQIKCIFEKSKKKI